MFIPEMIGLLAVAALIAAAILAGARAVVPARRLAVAGLAVAVAGILLATETEVRHRDCLHWNSSHVRYKRFIAPGEDPIDDGSPRPKDCERWPW